jgi:hypothetical protein
MQVEVTGNYVRSSIQLRSLFTFSGAVYALSNLAFVNATIRRYEEALLHVKAATNIVARTPKMLRSPTIHRVSVASTRFFLQLGEMEYGDLMMGLTRKFTSLTQTAGAEMEQQLCGQLYGCMLSHQVPGCYPQSGSADAPMEGEMVSMMSSHKPGGHDSAIASVPPDSATSYTRPTSNVDCAIC